MKEDRVTRRTERKGRHSINCGGRHVERRSQVGRLPVERSKQGSRLAALHGRWFSLLWRGKVWEKVLAVYVLLKGD